MEESLIKAIEQVTRTQDGALTFARETELLSRALMWVRIAELVSLTNTMAAVGLKLLAEKAKE